MYTILKSLKTNEKGNMERVSKTIALADLEGGVTGVATPLSNFKNKRK